MIFRRSIMAKTVPITKTIAAAIAIGLFSVCAWAQVLRMQHDIGESDFVPPPRLIEPSTDVIDLRGKDSLTLRWSPYEGDPIKREYYDLRLYKGYQALSPYLMLKMRVPRNVWSVQLRSDIFENGIAYTCALRQVYLGLKSRRTFWSFKIIK